MIRATSEAKADKFSTLKNLLLDPMALEVAPVATRDGQKLGSGQWIWKPRMAVSSHRPLGAVLGIHMQ